MTKLSHSSRPVRRAIGTAGLALAILAVAGCGSSDDASTGSGDQLTIGVTVATNANPFYVTEQRAVEAAGKKIGAKVLSANGNEDVSTQSDQIDSFVRSKADFIIVDAVDSQGVGPAVLRAKQAKIPVIAIDTEARGADITVTTNNRQAGRISCEALVSALNGQGEIAILDGTPITGVAERVEGCKQTLAKHPGVKVVATQRGDNSRDKALSVASDIFTAHPDIDGVFAINDPTAAGVELAAKQKSRKPVITSVDGAKTAIDSITGSGLIAATAAQDPTALAEKGVEVGAALTKGQKPAKTEIELPTELIDRKTAPDYTPWG